MVLAGRQAEFSCLLPSIRGEGTTQPIRSLLPRLLQTPREEWVGGSLEGPLEEVAGWGEQWDCHPRRLAAVPSPQQRAVPSLPVSPPLPLLTDRYFLQWDGGRMANTRGSQAPQRSTCSVDYSLLWPENQFLVSCGFRFVLRIAPPPPPHQS